MGSPKADLTVSFRPEFLVVVIPLSLPTQSMVPQFPEQSSSPDFVVTPPNGSRAALPEGEFRSLDGKLLFVRRGDRLEIRCPRSKALYVVEWVLGPEPEERDSLSSPTD